METQLEIHGKRVLFFTKVFLTFFIITILLFLNFLDFKENNQNRKYLNLINDVYQKGDEKLSFENYELERIAWLEKNYPELSKRHIQARTKVVTVFNEYGGGITRMTKGEGENENKFILMNDSALRNRFHYSNENSKRSGYSEANVDSALNLFNRYADSDKAMLLLDIDTLELTKKFDALLSAMNQNKPNEFGSTLSNGPINDVRPNTSYFDTSNVSGKKNDRMDLFSRLVKFEGAYTDRDKLVIATSNDIGGRFQSPVQQSPTENTLEMPVKTIEVNFPSTLEFAGFDKKMVNELYNDLEKKKELKNLYGYFDLNTVSEINSKAFEKQNDSVSILGFDISRKWFPIAMLLVLLITHIILFLTLKKAKSTNKKIISKYQSDDALDFLLVNYWIRFFIWVINPLLLLFFALYATIIQYNIWIYSTFILAAVICVILGSLSFGKSLHL